MAERASPHRLRDGPKPEIPFGDFYVAWSSNSLNLAMIAMDHYDFDLLAYEDEFSLEETFRIVWGVDAGGGAVALRLIPFLLECFPNAARR